MKLSESSDYLQRAGGTDIKLCKSSKYLSASYKDSPYTVVGLISDDGEVEADDVFTWVNIHILKRD